MFGLSFAEFLVIFLISLIFFKPHQIFDFFAKVSGLFRRLKDEVEVLKGDMLESELNPTEKPKSLEGVMPDEFAEEETRSR